MSAERLAERLELLGLDRQPGGSAMAAEALEMIGAGAEAAVEVERRDRASRALPAGGALGDQHHRAVEALDEP